MEVVSFRTRNSRDGQMTSRNLTGVPGPCRAAGMKVPENPWQSILMSDWCTYRAPVPTVVSFTSEQWVSKLAAIASAACFEACCLHLTRVQVSRLAALEST